MPEIAEKHASYADEMLGRARAAADKLRALGQEQIDRIVTSVADAAFDARFELAQAACDETGIGVVAHKAIKNAWASLCVHADIIGRPTVGTIAEDPQRGLVAIAEPRGPLLAITPLTNPTSTAIFKVLIALKTRNPLIFSPHRAAKKCSRRTAELLAEAAVAAGAPEDCIQTVTKADKAYLEAVMHHRDLAMIVATGTGKIVQTAQATGRPTIGVGPGNVPALIHASADVPRAVAMVLASKTFDHGTVCASEQALVVTRETDAAVREALVGHGALFCPAGRIGALGAACFDSESGGMRPDVVGRPAQAVAAKIDWEVPASCPLLLAELDTVGRDVPLCHEILGPVLAYYVEDSHEAALARCNELLARGGTGHTAVLHTADESVIRDFALRTTAGRVLVNQPATQGALGGFTNALRPSLTLAAGARANNDWLANVTIDHLIETRWLALPEPGNRWQALDADRLVLDESLSAADARHRWGADGRRDNA